MENMKYIKNYLSESILVKTNILTNNDLLLTINNAVSIIEECFRSGNKIMLAGNGGSAGDSQHIAAEFAGRFFYERPGLPAIALTTNTSMLTAIGNDYGFNQLFARQVRANGRLGDVFIGISTSGNSENVIKAVHTAKEIGMGTIALCGNTGDLLNIVDTAICVPSSNTPHIQECHIVIGHIICALIEKRIFLKGDINV